MEGLHLWIALLYLGGVLSGSLTVALGCVLPIVSALAHLSDREAGTLLMVQFASCAVGALFVRRNFHRTLASGYTLTAFAVLASYLLPRPFAIPSISAYGLGLGMVMTSNSMIVGRVFTARRGVALAFLNFCWSLGATLSPLLVAPLSRHFSMGTISTAVALLPACFVGITLLSRFHRIMGDEPQTVTSSKSAKGAIVYFGLLAFLYVGIESATGNWMSTYASRIVTWDYSRSSLATACFWSALLIGRAVAPLVLLRLKEEKLYLISVFAASAGVCSLVAAHSVWTLIGAAVFTGLGLAPVFPLTLSLFMTKAGQPRGSGWVFAVAGLGGAFVPWLTGFVSTDAGSLRIGMLVPAAATLLLLAMASRLRSV
jgi:MFS transporter, FHS family, glucose/mannose:H+ symporter